MAAAAAAIVDPDIVQEEPEALDDIVQEDDDDVRPPRRHRRPRRLATFLLRRHSNHEVHQVVALLWVFCRNALPEEEPTVEQQSMRLDAYDFTPAWFVEYVVESVEPLEQPIALTWPPTLGDMRSKLTKANHSADISMLSS